MSSQWAAQRGGRPIVPLASKRGEGGRCAGCVGAVGATPPHHSPRRQIMSTPRWMPRSAVALAAVALGTAGLGLAMVPSFAQESKPPTTEQPVPPGPGSDLKPPAPPSDLKEGGDAAQKSGPGVSGAQENGNRIENVAANLTLESARIESINLNDTDQEYVVYHFGRVVHEISDVQGFILKGF